jgi:hypothetical protein
MIRLAVLAAAASLFGQTHSIDRLLATPDRADLKWTVSVTPPMLSSFQRIWLRITIRVDGKEIEGKTGVGDLVFAAEFKDAAKKAYRTTKRVASAEFAQATSRNELECVLHSFVLPGSYETTLAVIDLKTQKRSVTHRTVRIAPPNGDPLPDMWRDLPAVDFMDLPDAPDRWFFPGDLRRLSLDVKTQRPPQLKILANIAPSESSQRQRRAFDRNMDAIVPSLKVLCQIGIGSREVELIDLARRSVEFEQHGGDELNWPVLRQSLTEESPNKITAGALKDRDQELQFFASEASRLAAGPERRVLIVMSAPFVASSHQELKPAPPVPKARVFYLRFQPRLLWSLFRNPGASVIGGPPPPNDDLARALKPLQPRLIDIFSPLDFRKALAAILKEIEQ